MPENNLPTISRLCSPLGCDSFRGIRFSLVCRSLSTGRPLAFLFSVILLFGSGSYALLRAGESAGGRPPLGAFILALGFRDTNKDGILDSGELGKIFNRRNKAKLMLLDADGDGTITTEEVRQLSMSFLRNRTERIRQTFRDKFDHDGDGRLSLAEAGGKAGVLKLFRNFDTDGNEILEGAEVEGLEGYVMSLLLKRKLEGLMKFLDQPLPQRKTMAMQVWLLLADFNGNQIIEGPELAALIIATTGEPTLEFLMGKRSLAPTTPSEPVSAPDPREDPHAPPPHPIQRPLPKPSGTTKTVVPTPATQGEATAAPSIPKPGSGKASKPATTNQQDKPDKQAKDEKPNRPDKRETSRQTQPVRVLIDTGDPGRLPTENEKHDLIQDLLTTAGEEDVLW